MLYGVLMLVFWCVFFGFQFYSRWAQSEGQPFRVRQFREHRTEPGAVRSEQLDDVQQLQQQAVSMVKVLYHLYTTYYRVE